MSETIQHIYTPPAGGIDAKVTHSTQGISLELDVTRPRQESESFEQAAQATAELVADAYARVVRSLEGAGVALGPFKKATP